MKKSFRRWCFSDSYLKFRTTFFCYRKRGSAIYHKSNYAIFASPIFLYFSTDLSNNGLYLVLSVKKSLKVVKIHLLLGFADRWLAKTLTQMPAHWYSCQVWFIFMHCSQKTFHFLSVSNSPHLFYQIL